MIHDYESIGLFLVIIHLIISGIIILNLEIKFNFIILFAFLIRIVFMLWDLYARNIFILPNSEGDTQFYYDWAVRVGEDLTYLTQGIRGGLYSKIIGILFYFTGPMRILAQYINVLFGLMVVIVVNNILSQLKVNT
ncbi:MAG: hypothetical protein VB121_12045, partial [Enterococcus thailandicus]|nr:hypothetical protein [Enterococcus thailandicus]